MSEYNNIQYSWFVNGGDQTVLRADDPEEFAKLTEEFASVQERALKAINATKQAQIAAGVFTGENPKAKGGNAKRAADTPPPAAQGGDSIPTCEHGEMKDLRANNYKYDFYCPSDEKDWKKRCKPVKL
jgi:hypothetical protein